ncbi:hypothetical protein [Methylophaga sp. OBS4]|uniref:hypothetical protein n=1 Tax=Methylophaga sp. OBS4 TaxID=2991935 RepID=UPI00224FEEB0|nr:hypothetical protein [Methylophaga sp. OBS4]MCX4186646.1 hypothetical protein [Methylophaga sp. OBS4]
MRNTETLHIARIRGASIVKLILLGSTIGWALLTSIFGIAALFGVEVVQWNDQYVTGIKGLIVSPFIGAIVGVLFGLFSAIFTYVGLRIYSLFRGFSVEYIPASDDR